MTIECYYTWCKYHGCFTDPNDGSFCYEEECRVSEEQANMLGRMRALEYRLYELNQHMEELKAEFENISEERRKVAEWLNESFNQEENDHD